MNVLSMSGIMLGGMSLLLSVLIMSKYPAAIHQMAAFDFPLTSMKNHVFAIAPPVLFSVCATVASLLALNSRIGKYTFAANLILLLAVFAIFIW